VANDLEIRIGAELSEIKSALAQLRTDLKDTGNTGKRSGRDATQGFDGLEGAIRKATTALAGFVTIYTAIQALRGITGLTDEFARYQAQLRLTTDSQEELAVAQRETFRIAQETRAPLAEVANTYATLQRSTDGLGFSQEELVRVLETVNKSIALTPVAAETARQTLVQFGQALTGNFKAGAQELQSIIEQTPGLAQAIADGLGVQVSALKGLGEQGKISTELVVNGLIRISDQIDDSFGQIPQTVSGALTQLRNDLLITFGEADVTPLTDGIKDLRDTLTDPNFQQSLIIVAGLLVSLTAGFVSATAGVVELVQTIAEDLAAAINGVAADDIPRLTNQLKVLKLAVERAEAVNPKGRDIIASLFGTERTIDRLRRQLAEVQALYDAAVQAQQQYESRASGGETPEQRRAKLQQEAEARIALARAAQEQAAEEARLAKEQEARQKQVDKTLESLTEEAATYGRTAEEVIQYRLATMQATPDEINRAVALTRTIEALKEKEQAEKDAAKAVEEAAELQRKVAEQLVDIQLRTLEASGRTVEATRVRLQLQFAELFRGLQATGNQAGVELVQGLIDTEVSRAQFAEIERQFDETVQQLQARQQALADQVTVGAITAPFADEQGRAAREEALVQLQALTAQMQALAQASGDAGLVQAADAATAALQRLEIEGLTGMDAALVNLRASWAQLQRQFAQSAVDAGVNAVTQFFTDLASGSESAGDALRNFVRNFAASMAQIAARALATYAVLQLLDAVYPGLGKSVSVGMSVGVQHRGGMAGSGPRRNVNPLLFLGAPRYHDGGMVGLKQGEVPAILQTGEEVLSRADPRNQANGGGSGYRIINVVDPSMAGEFLESASGERAILNVISRNAGQVRQSIG